MADVSQSALRNYQELMQQILLWTDFGVDFELLLDYDNNTGL